MLDAHTHTQSHQTWCCLGDIYGRTGKLNEVRMKKNDMWFPSHDDIDAGSRLVISGATQKKNTFQKTERIATNESKT